MCPRIAHRNIIFCRFVLPELIQTCCAEHLGDITLAQVGLAWTWFKDLGSNPNTGTETHWEGVGMVRHSLNISHTWKPLLW